MFKIIILHVELLEYFSCQFLVKYSINILSEPDHQSEENQSLWYHWTVYFFPSLFVISALKGYFSLSGSLKVPCLIWTLLQLYLLSGGLHTGGKEPNVRSFY